MKTLFESLCAFPLLHQAWLIVLQKKSIGGIDNINLQEYSRNVDKRLAALSAALRQRNWKPQPYLGVTIPKNKFENRELGLLSIEDKVVQQALKILIEPRLEKRFYSCSYAYRPGRGHLRAIKRTLHECKQTKNQWYLKLDIDNFFDTIDHNILFSRLKVAISDLEICRLVELCMTMGHVNLSMEWKKREKGIPQGAILSPLLANLYLTSFDQFVLSCTTSYIRYADDFVVWCETQDVATSLHEKITKHLNVRLNLGLNPSVVGSVADGIEFLGVIVRNCSISISKDKQHKLCERIRQIEIVDSRLSKRYLESLAGIHRYYATILPEEYVLSFTSALRMAISDWITSNSEYSKKELQAIFQDVSFFGASPQENQQILSDVIQFGISRRTLSSVDSRKELNKRLIRARKLEYQHREGDNSELVVASFGYFIGVSNRGITLRRKGVQIPVPPSTVLKHITILSDGVSISSNAIAFCMLKNIPIDFFDSHSLHIASIVSPKFLQTTLWDMQSRLSLEKRVLMAKKIIEGKLRNQLNLIKYFHKYHKTILDFDVQYTRIESSFKEVLMKLRISPISEQYQELIMAQEAQGALLYWEYVRLLIEDDDVGFEFREHQGATDLVNSMLNYGYAILYPRIWQAILRHRLNPYMGFIHYQDGNANLVFDIIELFRSQAVDRVVISMIQKKERLVMKAGKLDDTTRSLLTKNIFERLNRYEKYRGIEHRFSDIINLQVTELTSCLTDNTTYRPYIAKW